MGRTGGAGTGTVAAGLAATALVMAMAARPPADTLAAAGGDITIQPINHATLQLVHAGHVIDVDPVAQGDDGR